MKKDAFLSILRKPVLLVFVFAVLMIMGIVFAGCGGSSNQKPPEMPPTEQGDGKDKDKDKDKEDEKDKDEWDISASPVKASLIADGDHYTLSISGSGDMKSWDKAEDVPWSKYSDKITAVTIGDHITGIGDYAFSGIDVPSLMIPQSVKSIGSHALPAGVTVYAYDGTEIAAEQGEGITVGLYSEGAPETHDRHWTSWGSSGNITDAPFVADALYWHFDENDKPVRWEKIKILFIGNSFTFYYQIPKQFDAIAEDLGYYVETYSITVPGQTLETHANASSNSGVQISALLNQVHDFNYVVLQEQSTRPYTEYDKFFNAIKALKKKIDDTQVNAQVYLYETWGSPASAGNTFEEIAEMEQKLYEAYTQAAGDLNCNVSYVGRAFTLIKRETDLNLYFGDNRHPGPIGSYLSACVHVATILGGDVRNTTLTGADMSVISNEGGTPQPTSVTEAQCETLRAAAYKIAFEGGQEAETYTVRFWYNGQVQTTKTATVGFGFVFPSCTVEGDEKFSGWKLQDGDTLYAADSSIGYAAVSEKINEGVLDFYAETREMIIAVWGGGSPKRISNSYLTASKRIAKQTTWIAVKSDISIMREKRRIPIRIS